MRVFEYLQMSVFMSTVNTYQSIHLPFLVSGCGLACQQEISLILAQTPPINYYKIDG